MAISNLPTANEEDFRRAHHWQFSEISCCLSAVAHFPSGLIQCLSAVPSGMRLRIRELTIHNMGYHPCVVFLDVSGFGGWVSAGLWRPARTKLRVSVPANTTRVWYSQDGRVFQPGERPCLRVGGEVFTSCLTPSCVFITGAGLLE